MSENSTSKSKKLPLKTAITKQNVLAAFVESIDTLFQELKALREYAELANHFQILHDHKDDFVQWVASRKDSVTGSQHADNDE